MERLARPLTDLQEHYDIVVAGSGYGGSIAACRLSRAGRRVALLERGREIHPGRFPSTLTEAGRQLQVSAADDDHAGDDMGDPQDLYWLHVGADVNVLSGCGLGGTSLINANVSLRPDPRILDDERWPRALRADGAALDAGYARAEAMLRPSPYPSTAPVLAKMEALRAGAGSGDWAPTPINVTFVAGPNAAGVHQEACNGCGDCVTGCNYGVKNTVLMNYLPDAVGHGAEIFTEIDVRVVEKGAQTRGSGPAPASVVRAQPLGVGRDHFDAPTLAISADVVVLAAGWGGRPS